MHTFDQIIVIPLDRPISEDIKEEPVADLVTYKVTTSAGWYLKFECDYVDFGENELTFYRDDLLVGAVNADNWVAIEIVENSSAK